MTDASTVRASDLCVIIEWPAYRDHEPLDVRTLRILDASTEQPIWSAEALTLRVTPAEAWAELLLAANADGSPAVNTVPTTAHGGVRLETYRARVTDMRVQSATPSPPAREIPEYAVAHWGYKRQLTRFAYGRPLTGPGEARLQMRQFEEACEVCDRMKVPEDQRRHGVLVREVTRWRKVEDPQQPGAGGEPPL